MHQNHSKNSSKNPLRSQLKNHDTILKIVAGTLLLLLVILGVQFRPLPQKKQPAIQLSLSYTVKNKSSVREGKLGDRCYTGDHIFLSVSADTGCWLMVFYVSIKEVPEAIFPEKLEPVQVSGRNSYQSDFFLNDVPGHELYYAVAAHERFTFDELIPHLDTLRDNLKHFDPDGNAKGPLNTPCNLNLPEGFSSEVIYFNHVPVEGKSGQEP